MHHCVTGDGTIKFFLFLHGWQIAFEQKISDFKKI